MNLGTLTTTITSPGILLRLEGLAFLVAACALYRGSGYHWGEFFLLFLLPDLLMVGYLFGVGTGAWAYNAGHTYSVSVALWLLAYLGHLPSLTPLALIWAAHIAFDRLLGYGLKYPSAFKDTHLGRV